MDITFGSLEELYKRIKPALKTKKEEMRRAGYIYIKEEDIWNYLKEVKWINAKNLSLYQMVSDVLNSDNMLIDKYLKEKLNLRNRVVYFEN
ncbi:MAG: hypothetical protein E7157_06005 [Lactobacillales bacterium]|nr:hypothetical protein [Lactobacillales bacterium]